MANRLGVLLRDARRRAGLTQEGLAVVSGVGVRTIRRLETGGGNEPRIGTVTLLADALDVTPEQRRDLLAAIGGQGAREGVPAGEAAPSARAEPPAAPGPLPGNLPAVPTEVSEAADDLARVVAAGLRREEEQRRVHDPFPLPVRWRQAPEHLTDHWDNICRVPAGVTAHPLDLAGDVGDIAGVYRRVPSGRMVVLGRAGSGKTVLTMRFVLDTLAARTRGGAVPVVFDIGSWDPAAMPLRTWLVKMLHRDHPGLAAAAPGGATLAAVLVDTGRILPVLDGFDEIAGGLQRPALETLNALSMPLLLTSRFDEYEQAVTAVDVLTSAAVVELTDLTCDDLAAYLPRTARSVADRTGAKSTAWDGVLDVLRNDPSDGPGAHLAAVLKTPLMVGLARTVYSDSREADPADLLDAGRFLTAQAIEDHLLDSFVPTVYHELPAPPGAKQRDWDVDTVRHWLGFLANDLDRRGTHDLEWWRVGSALRRRHRVLLVMLAAGLTAAAVDFFIFTPLNVLTSERMDFHWQNAVISGLVIGLVIGIPFGLVYLFVYVRRGRPLEPTRVRVRFDRAHRKPGLRRKLLARFGAGALGGAVAGVAYAAAIKVVQSFSPELRYQGGFSELMAVVLLDAVLYALMFGMACGATLALAAALEAPANLTTATSPAELLAANRTTALRLVGVLGVTFTLLLFFGSFAVTNTAQALLSVELSWDTQTSAFIAGEGALCVGFGFLVAFTAWGQWLLFTRIRLPLTGRLPWAVNGLLEDAYRRGVLRQSGAVYQFRHASLQEHLARSYRARRQGVPRST